MMLGKLSERRKPSARRGRMPLVDGGRPHGFAALSRHDDSALEWVHLEGRLWRLLAPSPAPEPFLHAPMRACSERPDIGAAVATDLAGKARLKIG